MRVLAHIKKLDDCFGQFLVRVSCKCGAVREITPEALARLVGWSMTLEELARRMRCSQCGKKAAEVVAVARPRPRGWPHGRFHARAATRCPSVGCFRRRVGNRTYGRTAGAAMLHSLKFVAIYWCLRHLATPRRVTLATTSADLARSAIDRSRYALG